MVFDALQMKQGCMYDFFQGRAVNHFLVAGEVGVGSISIFVASMVKMKEFHGPREALSIPCQWRPTTMK